jgi:signal transduction histidine kinase
VPLAWWTAGWVLGAGVGGLALASLGMRISGASPFTGAMIVVGVLVAGAGSLAAGMSARRTGNALGALHRDALRRLSEPEPTARPAILPVRELRELHETLDALASRVRVADEIAERRRRTAATASAGMYELLSGLVAAEEGARGQLAAELHDTVAQTLMTARSMLAMDQQEPDEVRRAAELICEAEEQVRGVMARTRPPALREGDLALAVSDLCDDMNLRYALEVELDWPTEPRPLPLATAVTVYRFLQEALLNVVKHADVFTARAALRLDGRYLIATVTDRGPGFDPDEVAPVRGRHVGLGLLRERSRLAGGSLQVTSWPGDGTTLELRLPLAASPGSLLSLSTG